MITNPTPSSSPYISKKSPFYQIAFEQDAIFSGCEYFNSLETSLEISKDITWHIKDGECILKGQVCMEIFQEIENLNEILKVISYLSGISTLARCYTESSHHTSIIGTPLKNSPWLKWETKSLSYGGVDTKPCLPEKICYSEKDLNLQDQIIALSSKMPRDELVKCLKKLPDHKIKGLYGFILPQDLEKLSDLPINVIWPDLLQGSFPCVKIKIHGNK